MVQLSFTTESNLLCWFIQVLQTHTMTFQVKKCRTYKVQYLYFFSDQSSSVKYVTCAPETASGATPSSLQGSQWATGFEGGASRVGPTAESRAISPCWLVGSSGCEGCANTAPLTLQLLGLLLFPPVPFTPLPPLLVLYVFCFCHYFPCHHSHPDCCFWPHHIHHFPCELKILW